MKKFLISYCIFTEDNAESEDMLPILFDQSLTLKDYLEMESAYGFVI